MDTNYQNLINYLISEKEKELNLTSKSYSPSQYFSIKREAKRKAELLLEENNPILKQFGLYKENKVNLKQDEDGSFINENVGTNTSEKSDPQQKKNISIIDREKWKTKNQIKSLANKFSNDISKLERNFSRDFSRIRIIKGVSNLGVGGTSASSGAFGSIFGTAGSLVSGAMGLSGSLLSGASSFVGTGISLGGTLLGAGASMIPGVGIVGNIASSLLGNAGGFLFGGAGALGGMALSGLGSLAGSGIGLAGSLLSMPGNLFGGTSLAPLLGIASLIYNGSEAKKGNRFEGIKKLFSGGFKLENIKDMGFDDLLDFSSGLGSVLALVPETSGFGISLIFASEIARYIKNKWDDIVGKSKELLEKYFGITDKNINDGYEKIKTTLTWLSENIPIAIEKLDIFLKNIKNFGNLTEDDINNILDKKAEEYFGMGYTVPKSIYKFGKKTQKYLYEHLNPLSGSQTKDGKNSMKDAEKYVNEHLYRKTDKKFGDIISDWWKDFHFVKEASAAEIPKDYFKSENTTKNILKKSVLNNYENVTNNYAVENNIGNMRASVGFQKFSSMEEGIAANVQLLGFKKDNGEYRYNQKTIREIAYKWAPPEDHNDTEQWIKIVSKVSGFSPNEKLDLQDPVTLKKIIKGIGTIEHGSEKIKKIDDEVYEKGIQLGLTGKKIDSLPQKRIEAKSPSIVEGTFNIFEDILNKMMDSEFQNDILKNIQKNVTPNQQEIDNYKRIMNLPTDNNGVISKLLEGVFQPIANSLQDNLKNVQGEITHLNTNFIKTSGENKKEEYFYDPTFKLVNAMAKLINF